MAPVSTVFQDDYAKANEPEHVHAGNKRQTHILDANYESADLKEIIKCISTIDDIERNRLSLSLRKYEHMFDETLRKFEKSDVKFDLKDDAKPYHAKEFPVPKNHHDTLKHEIELLVELGVFKRCSDSEWAAPTFIIPKKNGKVRFISDFGKLNEERESKPYPIPKIAQILQELEMYAYATSLDFNMGYYTIRLHTDSQKLCIIVTPFGKDQYLRLPMGISCSQDVFQDKMSDLMQNLIFLRTYLDDLLLVISSSTFDDHLEKLEVVLKLLSDKGFRVNAEKATFCADEIEYLGYCPMHLVTVK
jgi:hypothetical protein